ncbi:MAG TPA: NYN domain-containing protein [Bryobacteraceae bacterium]|nr:NYN domain-containing protein [Bryobacteraceae bacterium]
MQDRLNIAVFVDYDNIEIGVKSTLRREFDVSLALNALKERGDIVAKFAYANWGRQEGATRQMAENAVQMVQRIPSPRGDKNGADINLALDALEMAFTHAHVNAFAVVSGDSDFIPLVNKLKEYGKTVFVLGGKAFTSTILQQNCHEFVSYESLLEDGDRIVAIPMPDRRDRPERQDRQDRPERQDRKDKKDRGPRPAPLDLAQAVPLVERALQVLERRAVQPQLGLLKSTMLQLDPAFSERAYGAGSFSDFVDKLKKADYINVSGSGGRYIIERRGGGYGPEKVSPKPEEALPLLRDVLETHRMELENGATADELEQWMQSEHPDFNLAKFGFQQFTEFLNYAQDKTVVRTEPDEERGLIVSLGAEFYPPALPEAVPEPAVEEDEDEPQPIVEGQPTIFEPNPPPPKPKKVATRKRPAAGASATRRPRKRKTE